MAITCYQNYHQQLYHQDFAAAGHTWTASLCKMDSDKDGRSNGLEVGDPDCKWSKANPTPLKKAIGQPGNNRKGVNF